MARVTAAAATVVSAILSCGAVAHAQSFACGNVGVADADPPLDAELAPPGAPRGSCVPLIPSEVSESELEGVLIGGASAAALGYVVANVLVATQPHRTQLLDGIPVFGAVWSVAHNEASDRTTPLLLFSAGVQAIGLLVTIAAATELHDLRRLGIEVGGGACSNGGAVSFTWRY